jgi:hypothetical protein
MAFGYYDPGEVSLCASRHEIRHPNMSPECTFHGNIWQPVKSNGRREKFVLMCSRVSGVRLGLYQRHAQP